MKRQLGYQTPAIRLEGLEQEIEQLKTVSGNVKDALLLAALGVILSYQIVATLRPQVAREIKDIYVDMLEKLDINATTIKVELPRASKKN